MGANVRKNLIRNSHFCLHTNTSTSVDRDGRTSLRSVIGLVFFIICAMVDSGSAIAGFVENHKLMDVGGASIAMAGNRVVVGSPNGADNKGAVHVYRYDGGVWVEEQVLTALEGQDGDGFGFPVALNSTADRIAVGAPGDGENGFLAGAVYVFSLNAGTWVQEQKIIPSDGEATDQFGRAVGISADRVVIGSPFDDDKGSRSGAVYVYRLNSEMTMWIQEQKLLAPDGGHEDSLGFAVAIDGERIVAGAIQTNNCSCLPLTRTGSAYIFGFDNASGSWSFKSKLVPPDGMGGDLFGNSVSLSENRIVVGTWFGNYAYVYRVDIDTAVPEAEQKLQPSDGAASTNFGFAVAIGGDRLVVGAPGGNKLYLFEFDGGAGVWVQKQDLITSDAAMSGQFGRSVTIAGDFAAVGSEGDAYIFRFTPDSDSDGVADNQDQCPNTPSGAIVDTNGCAASQLDTDGDGITDDQDMCTVSDIRPTVIVESCNSGVVNALLTEPIGCTITDEILSLAETARSHGQFVSQVDQFLRELQKADVLEPNEKNAIKDCASQSSLP